MHSPKRRALAIEPLTEAARAERIKAWFQDDEAFPFPERLDVVRGAAIERFLLTVADETAAHLAAAKSCLEDLRAISLLLEHYDGIDPSADHSLRRVNFERCIDVDRLRERKRSLEQLRDRLKLTACIATREQREPTLHPSQVVRLELSQCCTILRAFFAAAGIPAERLEDLAEGLMRAAGLPEEYDRALPMSAVHHVTGKTIHNVESLWKIPGVGRPKGGKETAPETTDRIERELQALYETEIEPARGDPERARAAARRVLRDRKADSALERQLAEKIRFGRTLRSIAALINARENGRNYERCLKRTLIR